MIIKTWQDLPKNIEDNIDIFIGLRDDSVKFDVSKGKLIEYLNQVNVKYDFHHKHFEFESEAHYTWFIMRCS